MEILSTGGTAGLLAAPGLPVTEVSDYTGFPEMMDGRVKTLHPRIHGGILGRRGVDDAAMRENGIRPIDLVAVNLYPFESTVANPDCDLAAAIENIDIGGPTLLRAAAKNHAASPYWSTRRTIPGYSPRSPTGGGGQQRHPFRPGGEGLRAHGRL